jgi:cytoskeletal protein CcmA (bactofilin family)
VRDLIVFGNLAGNIHAPGRVELRQSASVKGDIFAGRLSIEESAMFTGRVELKSTSESASSAAAPGPAKTTQPEAKVPVSPQPTA